MPVLHRGSAVPKGLNMRLFALKCVQRLLKDDRKRNSNSSAPQPQRSDQEGQ